MALPKFKYGTPAQIDKTSIVNGALIVDSTNGHLLVDLNGTRISLSDVIRVANADSLPEQGTDKLYLNEATNDIYCYINNEWHNLTDADSPILIAETNAQMAALSVAANIGKVVLFVGTTNSSYTKGHFYLISEIPGTSTVTIATNETGGQQYDGTFEYEIDPINVGIANDSGEIVDGETYMNWYLLSNGLRIAPLSEGILYPGAAWVIASGTPASDWSIIFYTTRNDNTNAPPVGKNWTTDLPAYDTVDITISSGAATIGPVDITSTPTIALDNVPTQNSNNAVKSGGVYTALQDKMNTPASGATGQVLTKTENGYAWADVPAADLSGAVLKGTIAAMAAATVGQTLVFVETTTANYTKGHIYKCTAIGGTVTGWTIASSGYSDVDGTYTEVDGYSGYADTTGNVTIPDSSVKWYRNSNGVWMFPIEPGIVLPSGAWGITRSTPGSIASGDILFFCEMGSENTEDSWVDTSWDTVVGMSSTYGQVASAPTFEDITPTGSSITFDDSPTQGSNNAVKSGGMYSALQDKLSKPATAGTNGQVLTTDGEGGVSWTTVSGGASGNVVAVVDSSSTMNSNKTQANLGKVYLFSGETASPYTKGHHYLCSQVTSGGTITIHDAMFGYDQLEFTPSQYSSHGVPIYFTSYDNPYCLVLVKDASDDYYWAVMLGLPENHIDTTTQNTIDAAGYVAYMSTTLATANSDITASTTAGWCKDGEDISASFGTSCIATTSIDMVDITPNTDLPARVTAVETFINNIGVDAIVVVNSLPANPDANTLYLIRETSN